MKQKISIFLILIMLFSIFILGCGKEFVPADDTGVTPSGMAGLAEANNQFAFDMYAKLNDGKSMFFSPYSLSAALAMVYEGANGETAEEIRNVLYFPEDKTALRSSFAGIYNHLNKEDKKYKLNTANALWAQKDYTFLPTYVQTLNSYYGALSENLDFVNDAVGSADRVNDWVKDQTDGKIKDLISPAALNAQTRLILTNAIYFKGAWVNEFDKGNTDDDEFWITPEEKVMTPMMELIDDHFRYTETDDLQMIELPYKGYELSMFVFLPKENDLSLVEESLNAEKLNELQKQMQNQLVYLYFPKFQFDIKYSMVETLADMGMPLAFTWPGADFSGMDGTNMLYIDELLHYALIDVDEKGTTAIAATALFVGVGSAAPSEPVTFRADHPFVFLIQEKSTGNILFMGKVVDPSK